MKLKNNPLRTFLASIVSQTLATWTGIAAAVAVVGVVAWWLIESNKDDTVTISKSEAIGITPTQIASIKSIGQWEFLSIADEEMIDTVRHGFFGDDELVRIYYGTLRLGINLAHTKADWISQRHDSVFVVLPPVELLDSNFVDEARTRSFFEKGKWSQTDRANLYQRARTAMIKRCVTPANIRSTEQNAATQFSNMLHSMGIENAIVRVDKTASSGNNK